MYQCTQLTNDNKTFRLIYEEVHPNAMFVTRGIIRIYRIYPWYRRNRLIFSLTGDPGGSAETRRLYNTLIDNFPDHKLYW